jgi:hypothetical protein
MTTGWKIAIGVVSTAVVVGGIIIIVRTSQDWKEKEVLQVEEEQFGSLGKTIEIGRKKHPALADWYDGLTLNQTSLVEEAWDAMSELQKEKIFKGVKSNTLPPDIANFFRTKGAKV